MGSSTREGRGSHTEQGFHTNFSSRVQKEEAKRLEMSDDWTGLIEFIRDTEGIPMNSYVNTVDCD